MSIASRKLRILSAKMREVAGSFAGLHHVLPHLIDVFVIEKRERLFPD